MATDCPVCARAEMRPRQRLMADITKAIVDFYQHRSPAQVFMEGYAQTMRIMIGAASPEPNWYEKHRAEWLTTGDLAELCRMTRHVES